MGAAFLFVPLSCFLYTPDKSLALEPYISAVVNLTAYFGAFVLKCVAFLTLLGKRFGKLVWGAVVASIILFPVPAWLSLLSGRIEIIDTVITASYTYFVLVLLLSVISVLRHCSKAEKNIDNYYSDDLQICVSWIRRSIWLLMGMAVNCAIAPLLPIAPWWLRLFFLVYGMSCYLHIHYGYRRMMIAMIDYFMLLGHNISDLALVEQDAEADLNISTQTQGKIQSQLEEWISLKGYKQRGVTINMVAKEIGTNRTYLSRYINATYQCSFKTWITAMRVEEVKRLLSQEADMTTVRVSDIVGFASQESFNHVFTRLEGVSPSTWREEKCEVSNS